MNSQFPPAPPEKERAAFAERPPSRLGSGLRAEQNPTGRGRQGHPELPAVLIATDGAYQAQRSLGAWAFIARDDFGELCRSGVESPATSNRMELLAAILALESLTSPCRVEIQSDSRYLCDGASVWLPLWQKRQWRTVNKQPVKNADLWLRLDRASQGHSIAWRWVRGHSGHPLNERVDEECARILHEHRRAVA